MTTATAAHPTPAPATITPRDIAFDVDAACIADWAGGDVVRTAYFNALSLLFPLGERFFIASVSAYRGEIANPQLLRDVKGFVTQEGLHTREHLAYNELLRPFVDLDVVERQQREKMDFLKRTQPPLVHLAVTCALEHFTAIMAHELLSDDVHLAGAEPSFARMWRWHAIEECEHKSVAFDVFRAVTGGSQERLRRTTMVTITLNFLFDTLWNTYKIFQHRGIHRSPSTWARLGWFLLGKPGFLRKIAPAYLRYFRTGFHPSQIDDAAERARGLQAIAVA